MHMRYKLRNHFTTDPNHALEAILRNRGVEDIADFVAPTFSCELNPYDLENIEAGAEMMLKHLRADHNILFIVDQDADGFTSSSILWLYIKKVFPDAKLNFMIHEHKQHGLSDVIDKIEINPIYDLVICPDSASYDVEEHPTDNPEEAEKEALRAKRTLDNVRRKVKKDLELLYNASISWKEKIKGKDADFADVRILGGKGIKAGRINIEFSLSRAKYLIQLPLALYPPALLSLDERNNNAYNIGLKMAFHYSNDNNQIRGTAPLLKVKTLLECTNLPTISEVRTKERSWDERIKEPFEKALDALTGCGVLEDWRYSHSKGEEMTDEEATSFKNYEEWADRLVHFILRNAPRSAPRLRTREAEKKARQAKTKRKTTKKLPFVNPE